MWSTKTSETNYYNLIDTTIKMFIKTIGELRKLGEKDWQMVPSSPTPLYFFQLQRKFLSLDSTAHLHFYSQHIFKIHPVL